MLRHRIKNLQFLIQVLFFNLKKEIVIVRVILKLFEDFRIVVEKLKRNEIHLKLICSD
jgi:hypothetical protein